MCFGGGSQYTYAQNPAPTSLADSWKSVKGSAEGPVKDPPPPSGAPPQDQVQQPQARNASSGLARLRM